MEEKNRIGCFRRQYDYLSNFYPAVVTVGGLTYLNAEAAYQAAKCMDPKEREFFAELTPDEAKRMGRRVALRPDWEDIKFSVMEEVVRAKFTQNPHLTRFLAETGDAELIEGNYWHDTVWGVDIKTGEGQNYLGKILMKLRGEFRENGVPDETETSCESTEMSPIRMKTFPESFSVRFQDISQVRYDCIVNASDETLSGYGGVDAAIHRAAGPELMEACRALRGCRVTEAKLTEGYRLSARYVIHTVGPRYGQRGDAALLRLTYQNVLDLAAQNDIHSIAFPAISCGKFSYPKEAAAAEAVEAVRDWKAGHPTFPLEVIFTSLDLKVYNYFCQALGG